ncbi:MAG: serine hydrolase, partial [Xanthobacteraceae bacterium]
MKRWRSDFSTRPPRIAAALALLVLAISVGRPGNGNAEPASPVSLSRAKLEHVGDYIRREIAAGTMPGAVILIQQHGRPVYFESFGVRDVDSRRPMTP